MDTKNFNQLGPMSSSTEFRLSKKAKVFAAGLAITAAGSVGVVVEAMSSPAVVRGTAVAADVSPINPLQYVESNTRNQAIAQAVQGYAQKVWKDAQRNPEHTQFVQDQGPNAISGVGILQDTVESKGSTYVFDVRVTNGGQDLDLALQPGIAVTKETSLGNGKMDVIGTMLQENWYGDGHEPWMAQESTSQTDGKGHGMGGVQYESDVSQAKQPDATIASLSAAEQAVMNETTNLFMQAGL